MTRLRLAAALAVTVIGTAWAQPSGDVYRQVSRSVVKVETGGSAGSGFIWHDQHHAVTSLHVVDGHGNITVSYVDDQGRIESTSRAEVERVLVDADLVLLRIADPLSRPPLEVSTTPPTVNQSLSALGFPLNIAGYSSTDVKVRFGGRQLRTILPRKVLDRITSYPSLSLEILNIEANLVPGHSGAPIIDHQGRVVGVADGGLEDGAVGICWGIPAAQLGVLRQSTRATMPNSAGISELFAADLDADVGPTEQIGDSRLVKLRSRTFQQLAATADDQLGLNQLASVFAMYDPYSFRYDIYQDLDSGATLVVPEGAELQWWGDLGLASLGSQRMLMQFGVERVNGMNDAQMKSLQFENLLTEMDGFAQVIPDPAWSYMVPFQHFGVTINRKAMTRVVSDGFNWFTDKYYFETLATNGATLLAVAAVNLDHSPAMLELEAACSQGYNYPQCPQVFADRRIWAQMVLGVQMASFPTGQFGS